MGRDPWVIQGVLILMDMEVKIVMVGDTKNFQLGLERQFNRQFSRHLAPFSRVISANHVAS